MSQHAEDGVFCAKYSKRYSSRIKIFKRSLCAPENFIFEILAILDGFWSIDDGTTIEISENKIIWETDKVVIINDLGNSRFSTDPKISNLEASFTEDVIRWTDGDVWNRVKENNDNIQVLFVCSKYCLCDKKLLFY